MQYNLNESMRFAKPNDGSFNFDYVSLEIAAPTTDISMMNPIFK